MKPEIKLIFEKSVPGRKGYTLPECDVPERETSEYIPAKLVRKNAARLPEVSEGEAVRHFVNLSSLNHHIDKAIYPLGSCTMKYNPKINEVVSRLDGFSTLHPLQDASLVQGALEIEYRLARYLEAISGMDAVTLQPAAGSQGELTGLLLIRKFHEAKGERRKYILIPDSAHGTNPASVTMAGYEAVQLRSNDRGTVDIEDLRARLSPDVAGMMLTNPNTLGLFERQIKEIARLVHEAGALMYFDGANLNALLGIIRPGDIGFDIAHINLHKTFSTPHGGGGPGAGPVAVKKNLERYLPVPRIVAERGGYRLKWDYPGSIGRMHAFFGNFGMHVRAYTYIRMYGKERIGEISKNAIINANYLLARLKGLFTVPYPGPCMHELVLSGQKVRSSGIKVVDVAKRLLDYGVHAPTVYFPLNVREALMIEPTETESKESLDRFADALEMVLKEASENPSLLLDAPHNTPVARLDDAHAAKHLDVRYVFS